MHDLKDIQVGDAIAVYPGDRRPPVKREVTRTTTTQIIVGETRFSRAAGREVGAPSWGGKYAEPWTDKHDQRLSDAAAVAEQVLVIDGMLRSLVGADNAVRQLRYRDRPIDPTALERLREAVSKSTAMICDALKGVA
jgi:hypothetical protein